MRLQKVVHRKPVPFRPHETLPDYILVYCVETLACGHEVHTYPQTDPLIAIRRDCKLCGEPNVIEFPRRKPQPTSSPAERKRA